MSDELRALWDFGDLDATQRRFEERLRAESDDGERAELLTQLARVEGLRDNFDEGEQLVRQAEALAASSARARVRIDLERGRILRSGGDPGAALPLFESAVESALELDELFIAADAAHMAAIAAPNREERVAWTRRGIELAKSGDGSGSYWVGPLLNNLGWDQFEAEEFDDALETFQRALAHREEDPTNQEAIAVGRYAVAKALQALHRHEDAAAELELAIAWTEAERAPDGWFHEALAESSEALGNDDEARRHASLALELLHEQDSDFEGDGTRIERLTRLAGSDA